MIKGILLIDMIYPWNKFELCLKPVSKYISEQLTRPFAVLVLLKMPNNNYVLNNNMSFYVVRTNNTNI